MVVRDALDRIAVDTERLVQRQKSGALTVSTSPDFAAKWLVHRLGRFSEAYPDIDLRISATLHHVDFTREEADLAVRHGDGNWPSLDAIQLCPEDLFPVCPPVPNSDHLAADNPMFITLIDHSLSVLRTSGFCLIASGSSRR